MLNIVSKYRISSALFSYIFKLLNVHDLTLQFEPNGWTLYVERLNIIYCRIKFIILYDWLIIDKLLEFGCTERDDNYYLPIGIEVHVREKFYP